MPMVKSMWFTNSILMHHRGAERSNYTVVALLGSPLCSSILRSSISRSSNQLLLTSLAKIEDLVLGSTLATNSEKTHDIGLAHVAQLRVASADSSTRGSGSLCSPLCNPKLTSWTPTGLHSDRKGSLPCRTFGTLSIELQSMSS